MDWMGLDGLSYTAVTPRASLKSDANKHLSPKTCFITSPYITNHVFTQPHIFIRTHFFSFAACFYTLFFFLFLIRPRLFHTLILFHKGMSYLMSLNPMLLKNIVHVGSFKHFVFLYLRICVIV